MAATGEVLGVAMCPAGSKPSFVGLNFVNSGGDLAPRIVLNGAYAGSAFSTTSTISPRRSSISSFT